MKYSRLGRYQEKRLARRIWWALGGSIALLLFLFFFGVKILIGFSIFVDTIRGSSGAEKKTGSDTYIPAPELDPLPEATKSGTLIISGTGQSGLTVVLYKNDVEEDSVGVSDDGTFVFRNIRLKDGNFVFTARQKDAQGNESERSEPVRVTVKSQEPKLELSSPQDDATVYGEDNRTVTISGTTDESNSVTVNGRIVVVGTGGSFSYQYPLSEGDNTLTIQATDAAGNQKTIERKIKYVK